MATGGTNLSKEFFELLKAIGESKSKQEEDRIILKEVQTLKKKMDPPPTPVGGTPALNPLLTSKKHAKEFLVRLLYVEMLGHDASFGYIKAVEMAASASLYHKRTGYLVCGACLSPKHEFRFMLVNQMQRDLQSSHVLEICGGLLASCSLITSDMVPAMTTHVIKLLDHPNETVRKKAIICLHRFHQLAPDLVTPEEMLEKLRKVLCDRDPAVMGASLNVIATMAHQSPKPFKDLIPSFVSILKQIGEHRLPSDFDYHRVPAPWMQLKLIRILGILGTNDAAASSGMYEILHEALKKADVGINAGYAIVYECIRTIVAIYPNATLLDAAAEAISRLIQSRSHNLKYLGVTGLAAIVETHPQYAVAHQSAVMDCLEDPDETLQRKTLDLLYRMTNPVNVEFITEKLLDFLRGTTDLFLKKQLTTRICSVAERYAPNNEWYIQTITQLFEISGDMVAPQVAQNLMSLIAEGTGESDEVDMLLRQNAIELYATLLKEKTASKLPRILLETMAWCLGEYGYLSSVFSLEEILEQLCTLASKSHTAAPSTRKFLLAAIMKLVAQAGTCPPHAASVIDDYSRSEDVDLQQRCLEFQHLLTSAPHVLGDVLPVDASCEDLDVDETLSILNNFVHEALQNGAKEYDKPEDDDDDDDEDAGASGYASAFKMTPYEKPQTPSNMSHMMRGVGSDGAAPSAGVTLPPGSGYSSAAHGGTGGSAPSSANGELTLNTRNVASVWGKGGLATTPAAPTAPPAASTAPVNAYGVPPPAVASGFGSTSAALPYGGGFGPAAASSAPPEEPPKPRELTEKERMAAALFSGLVPGAKPPEPKAPPPKVPSRVPGVVPGSAPPPAAAAAAPPPPPAPAPEVDLLDMSFDIPAATSSPAAALPEYDILSPVPPIETPAPAPPAVVETVSSVEDEAEPPAAAVELDPFAASGLLGDMTDKPLASLETSTKFEYNGTPMAPLTISTEQFGQYWGTCSATSPATITGSKVDSLSKFMETCQQVGAHSIEAIAATNEGIAAGMVGGTHVVLIHGKVTPFGGGSARVDVTVKSTDGTLCGCLAMFLQNIMT